MPTPRPSKPIVVLGFLGVTVDAFVSRRGSRWEGWRPTISIVQQEDLVVSRFELLHQGTTDPLLKQVVEDIGLVSPETEVRPIALPISDPWDFEEVYGALHTFARNYPFKPDDEEYLVHITTGTHVIQICLFLLTESRHFPARLLQTSPPVRTEKFGRFVVIDLDLSRFDQIAARFSQEHREAQDALKSGIATRSAAFNRQIALIEEVALLASDPILLLGPTGAGKSSLARRIHELRERRQHRSGPLVDVNCATLVGDGAASALFGHRRGAYTGAAQDRAGLLRSADGGTLFLDEVGELGMDEQAMLLRALEEKRFLPLGADVEVTSDFHLIAGTNRDLRVDVRRGTFREDLLSRINLWTFHLPGLRDRLEDLEPNVEFELEMFLQKKGRRVNFSREAKERYLKFATGPDAPWPGNFRDLNASMTRLATLATSGRITVPLVDQEIERLCEAWSQIVETPGAEANDDTLMGRILGPRAEAIDLFDRVQLAEVLRVCKGAKSLSEAGRSLFDVSMRERRTRNDADRLRKYLLRFGIQWSDIERA